MNHSGELGGASEMLPVLERRESILILHVEQVVGLRSALLLQRRFISFARYRQMARPQKTDVYCYYSLSLLVLLCVYQPYYTGLIDHLSLCFSPLPPPQGFAVAAGHSGLGTRD